MNWIKQQGKTLEPSTIDKVKALLKIHLKLVLVQEQEIRILRKIKTFHANDMIYINNLYNHYVVLGLAKSYLYNY